jgi:uncharacterized repeat protein (TIGR01451 family)
MRPYRASIRPVLASLALAVAMLSPQEASAATAAFTRITNAVTVTYEVVPGVTETGTAAVTITVELVASAPNFDVVAPPVSIAQGQTATLSYTITSIANGPDTYNVTAVATATNVSAVTVNPTSVALGATTLAVAADGSTNVITVPYDGTDDTIVNGLAVGDDVNVGAAVYEITAIAENVGDNASTITLSGNPAAPAGAIVGEQGTFQLTVPSGTVSAGFGSGQQSVVATVASAADSDESVDGSATIVTVTRALLEVTKMVSVNGGAFGGNTNARPGDTLTYKITVENLGASDATSVQIQDLLPRFLSYAATSARVATFADQTSADSATYPAGPGPTDGADGDGYDYVAGPPRQITYAAPAAIPGGNFLVLFYQATLD